MILSGGFRVTEHQTFVDQIKQYFPHPERGLDGSPSRPDFVSLDLEPSKEIFSTEFYTLPELHPGRLDYRVHSFSGKTAPLIQIIGQLLSDRTTVQLLQLDVDHNPPEAFFRSSYR